MANIPPILRHMTLKIFQSKSFNTKVLRGRFKAAFDAAVSNLAKNGYITGGGVDFQETAKGKARHHSHEGMRGFVKDRTFDGMFLLLIREKTAGKKPSPDEKPETLTAHVLSQHGFPKEAPHADEPLYAHWKKPAKK